MVGRSDGSYAQRPHAFCQELLNDEAVVTAANLQEGDGKAVHVDLRVVRLASRNLRRGVYLRIGQTGECLLKDVERCGRSARTGVPTIVIESMLAPSWSASRCAASS